MQGADVLKSFRSDKLLTILSFDCGVKTLAYVVIKAPVSLNSYFQKFKSKQGSCGSGIMLKPGLCITNQIEILKSEMLDLVPGIKAKTLPVLERISALRKALQACNFDQYRLDLLLVEDQPQTNPMSREIMSAIIMYFMDKSPIIVVPPRLKNKIAFNEELVRANFARKSYSSYYANKRHSTGNYFWFLKENGVTEKKKKTGASNEADAFMQAIAILATNAA